MVPDGNQPTVPPRKPPCLFVREARRRGRGRDRSTLSEGGCHAGKARGRCGKSVGRSRRDGHAAVGMQFDRERRGAPGCDGSGGHRHQAGRDRPPRGRDGASARPGGPAGRCRGRPAPDRAPRRDGRRPATPRRRIRARRKHRRPPERRAAGRRGHGRGRGTRARRRVSEQRRGDHADRDRGEHDHRPRLATGGRRVRLSGVLGDRARRRPRLGGAREHRAGARPSWPRERHRLPLRGCRRDRLRRGRALRRGHRHPGRRMGARRAGCRRLRRRRDRWPGESPARRGSHPRALVRGGLPRERARQAARSRHPRRHPRQ